MTNNNKELDYSKEYEMLHEKIDKIIQQDESENHSYEMHSVITIEAAFGGGKSYFLNGFTDYYNKKKENNETYRLININIWKDDIFDDPLVTILCNIVEIVEDFETKHKSLWDTGKKLLQEIGKATVIGMTKKYLGEDTADVLKNTIDGEHNSNSIYDIYQERKKIGEKINKYLKSVTKDKPLVIIIDELDRVRPDYAVKFLEVLKHFFDAPKVVFILAVNISQFEQSVKGAFGSELNFDSYFRKFVSTPNRINFQFIMEDKLADYIELALKKENPTLYNWMSEKPNFFGVFVEFCIMKSLLPRQINDAVKILCHDNLSNIVSKGDDGYYSVFMYACIFYSVMIVTNSDMMDKILRNEYSINDMAKELETYHNKFEYVNIEKKYKEVFIMMLFTCAPLRKDIMKDTIITKKTIRENIIGSVVSSIMSSSFNFLYRDQNSVKNTVTELYDSYNSGLLCTSGFAEFPYYYETSILHYMAKRIHENNKQKAPLPSTKAKQSH